MSAIKIEKMFKINRKMDGGEETPFLDFVSRMKLKSSLSMEAFLEINNELFFRSKEGHIYSYHVPKRPFLKKIDF